MEDTIECRECGRGFAGTRREARAAHWEPISVRTQWDLDHGDVVCPACIGDLLAELLDALRRVS